MALDQPHYERLLALVAQGIAKPAVDQQLSRRESLRQIAFNFVTPIRDRLSNHIVHSARLIVLDRNADNIVHQRLERIAKSRIVRHERFETTYIVRLIGRKKPTPDSCQNGRRGVGDIHRRKTMKEDLPGSLGAVEEMGERAEVCFWDIKDTETFRVHNFSFDAARFKASGNRLFGSFQWGNEAQLIHAGKRLAESHSPILIDG